MDGPPLTDREEAIATMDHGLARPVVLELRSWRGIPLCSSLHFITISVLLGEGGLCMTSGRACIFHYDALRAVCATGIAVFHSPVCYQFITEYFIGG